MQESGDFDIFWNRFTAVCIGMAANEKKIESTDNWTKRNRFLHKSGKWQSGEGGGGSEGNRKWEIPLRICAACYKLENALPLT